jgi:RND family efflux transporter MFP subunit
MKRIGGWLALLVLVSAAGVLLARRSGPPTVAVLRPERRDVTRTLAVTGQVEAISNATLSSTLSGVQAQQVLVDKGSRVRAGQPVIVLDDRELRAAVQQAAAQARQAEANLLRARAQAQGAQRSVALAEQALRDSIDLKSQRDQAEANLQAAKARLAQARQNLIRTREGARQQAVRQAQAQLRQAEAQRRQAEAQLRLATLNLKREEELVREGASAPAALDLARANYENASEAVKGAQEQVIAAKEQVEQLAEPRTEDVRQAEAAVREAEAAVAGGQTALRNAERAYQNRTALRQALTAAQTEKLAADANVAAAEADLLRARAAQNQTQTQLSRSVLRAPVTGVVTDRNVEPGETVAAGTALLTIAAPRNLRIKADVDEANLHDIQVGQRAIVALDAYPALRLEGKVVEIVPAANSERGTVEVRIALQKQNDRLLPRLTADVNIVTGRFPGALTLPREAVLDVETLPRARVVENGKVVEKPLRVTAGDAGRVVVLEGLNETADVLANPNEVAVGTEVKTRPAKPEARS